MEIIGLILMGLIFIVIAIICIALNVCAAKKDSEYTFSCPNCGEKFNLNWQQIFPSHVIRHLPNHRFLRCPLCKKIDNLRMVDKEW